MLRVRDTLANVYVYLERETSAIARFSICSSSCSFTPEIASETISEGLESKHFMGACPQTPLVGALRGQQLYAPHIVKPDYFKSGGYGPVLMWHFLPSSASLCINQLHFLAWSAVISQLSCKSSYYCSSLLQRI